MKKILSLFYTFLALFPIKVVCNDSISLYSSVQDIPYSVNPDIAFLPHNTDFYKKISQEIGSLTCCSANQKNIALTGNEKAQKLAPTLYALLTKKVSTIAQRMGLDLSTVKICIQPTEYGSKSVFNAHAQTSVLVQVTKTQLVRSDGVVLDSKTDHETIFNHNLTLNAESLILLLFNDAHNSSQEESLLDGVIAHELAHIFHNHCECSIACEFEADATGAKSLLNQHNLINAVDLLYLAGNVYTYLHAYKSTLRLNDADILAMITIVTNSLFKKNNSLGSFSECSTHAAFSHKAQRALSKAIERIKSRNDYSDQQVMTSLLYDELLDACQTPLPEEGSDLAEQYQAIDTTLALYSQLTHPDPKSRRDNLLKYL